jgi:hypothetical protein
VQRQSQVREVLEEFRMAAQVAGDFHCVQSVLEAHFGHASYSPSKTNSAGPVIVSG